MTTAWVIVFHALNSIACLGFGALICRDLGQRRERRRVRQLLRVIIRELAPTPLFGGFLNQVDRDRKPPAWPPALPDGITPPEETRYIVARLEALDEAVDLGILVETGKQEPVDAWPDPPDQKGRDIEPVRPWGRE